MIFPDDFKGFLLIPLIRQSRMIKGTMATTMIKTNIGFEYRKALQSYKVLI